MHYKKEIVKLLEDSGFTKRNEHYIGETPYGQLNVRLDGNSIFMCFENLDLVSFKRKFSTHDLNEYSFKWNIHENTIENAYWRLEERISNLFQEKLCALEN